MTTALALVVDDSRMARHMLGKMLKEQGIAVDAVESGEEALGYLCDKKPSMIFMDHTMPGMDGFQTLRAIKNDPNTAAIPIIMYTSKEGEVYESQARALGAIGVIPKTLKPLELAKVLQTQNLLPGQTPVTTPVTPIPVRPAANDVVIVESGDASQDEQAPQTTDTKAANQTAELHALEQRLQQLTEQLQDLNNPPAERRANNRSPRLLVFGFALCVVLVGILLVYNLQVSNQISQTQIENASLRKALQEQAAPRQPQQTPPAQETRPKAPPARINQPMPAPEARRPATPAERFTRQEIRFAYAEKPFNEKLAETLSRLASNLHNSGYQGEINVRAHFGRFCTQTTDAGEVVLPERGQPLSSCEIMEFDDNNPDAVFNEQTPEFALFQQTFDSEYAGSIRLVLSSAADQQPLVRYPLPNPDMNATRWNAFAARNQRVEISVAPSAAQ